MAHSTDTGSAPSVPGGGVPGGDKPTTGATSIDADATQLLRIAPQARSDVETQVIPSLRAQADPAPTPEPAPAVASAAGASAVPAPSAQHRTIGMWASVVLYWLIAIPVGVLAAVLVAGRHATLCSKSSTGLGCSSTGSSIGIALLVVLVSVVGTVSVYAFDARRSPRRWGAALGIGLAVVAVIGAVAWLLVRTIQ